MKNILYIIAVVLLGLMASCTQESTHTIETIETETLYYFKATLRTVRLDYNTRGELYRTHAQEVVMAEEHGIRWAEVERLRTLWDRGTETEEGNLCGTQVNCKGDSWIITKTYKVEYTRTH